MALPFEAHQVHVTQRATQDETDAGTMINPNDSLDSWAANWCRPDCVLRNKKQENRKMGYVLVQHPTA